MVDDGARHRTFTHSHSVERSSKRLWFLTTLRLACPKNSLVLALVFLILNNGARPVLSPSWMQDVPNLRPHGVSKAGVNIATSCDVWSCLGLEKCPHHSPFFDLSTVCLVSRYMCSLRPSRCTRFPYPRIHVAAEPLRRNLSGNGRTSSFAPLHWSQQQLFKPVASFGHVVH
jgi:hypothetical protein